MCFSKNELRNPNNPIILNCIKEAKTKIEHEGDCKSKNDFKSLICEVGDFFDGSYGECMKSNKAVGPTVKAGKLPNA